jgi:integrase
MKNVPGRRTDWHACQWLQYLHSVGLLRGAFRTPQTADRRMNHSSAQIVEVQRPPFLTFRRGLATNLARLGVHDKVIQEILRHANVATTQASYIIVDRAEATRAMKKLSRVIGKTGIWLGQAKHVSH